MTTDRSRAPTTKAPATAPTVAQRHSDASALARLQRSAGNSATVLMVQRLSAGSGLSPPAPQTLAPRDDPRFSAVEGKLASGASALRAHPRAPGEIAKGQQAAVAPALDKDAQSKGAQAETMAAAKPGSFDKPGFIAAVKAAVSAQAPKNLEEADSFAASGKAEAVKTAVAGKVADGTSASAKDIVEATGASPDPAKAVAKPVTPLTVERPPAAVRLDAGAAMPAPAPAAETDLSAGKNETDAAMAEADVTQPQLATSNEPEFVAALDAKEQGEQHSAQAPGAVRAREAATLTASQTSAGSAGAHGVLAMMGAKAGATAKAAHSKGAAKVGDEAARARIATQITGIFDTAKADVQTILGGLDAEVSQRFDVGERAARDAFTADHKARMEAYKDARYSGVRGKLRWLDDTWSGLPAEANDIFVQARKLYESRMETVISAVADHIGVQLTRAKDRIALGRQQISTFVAQQPKDLRKIAADESKVLAGEFDKLEGDVDAKQEALVDDLASKYVDARNSVDDDIKAMQEANKGLWDSIKDAVGGAIRTILALKNMLLGVLARAASAVSKILRDPIGFLGNFVSAVKGGIVNFGANIGEHIGDGLRTWLLGSLGAAGIELPAKLDAEGIIKLVLSVLGGTWANIRKRILTSVPEPVLAKIEQTVDVFRILASEGLGGLWKLIAAKVGDIEEMVMGQISDFVITKIVKAGITWLISMLNPAAAFIKACKMIVDVVTFFVERASQIKEFVDSVLDSVESIADGGVGAVAGYIEKTLVKMVPVLIGFLASLLGLDGISEKIRSVLHTVQKPINKAIDGVIKMGLKAAKPLIRAFGKGADWVKGKAAAGKAWVGSKVTAGKEAWRAWRKSASFSVLGVGHSVSLKETTRGEFDVVVASTPKSPAAVVKEAKAATRRAMVDIQEVAPRLDGLETRARRLKELARAARMAGGRMPAEVNEALADLSRTIAAVWERIGFDGEHLERVHRPRGEAGEAGDVGAHKGGQGRRTDPAKAGRAQEVSKLESEHVIPWSWIDTIFSSLYRVGTLPKQAKSVVYPKMTTVMQYAGAAKAKTSQARVNSDMEVLNFFRGLDPLEARRTLRDNLPAMLEHRAQIIRNETVVWISKVKTEDGITLPDKPTPAQIRAAMAAQLAEIYAAARELT